MQYKNKGSISGFLPVLALLTLSVANPGYAAVTPGEYSAQALGLESMVGVKVTIDKDGVIKNIVVDASEETPELGGVGGPEVGKAIVEQQSLSVDAYTGATMTSNAVLEAVEDALKQSGADVNAYKK
ncbi:FMN-binding protein [Edaphovirga cremea]|uniref:FMN-binding protein n=1 Tax=Edaphovirga cremea TaxID=2267246 RepID=UPI000DEECA01|nr:FMN-binding protein [Edaphovirga cremea]